MSEIINYLIENITKLKSLDYFLILIFTLTVAFCIFLFFKWMYDKIIKTQHDVISLKDKMISSKNDEIEELVRQSKSLNNLLLQFQQQSKLSEEEAKEIHNRYSLLKAFLGISLYINTLYRICSNVKSEIMNYIFASTHFPTKDVACPHNLYDSLTVIENRIKEVLDELSDISLNILEEDSIIKISKNIIDILLCKEINDKLINIETTIDNNMNILKAAINKSDN